MDTPVTLPQMLDARERRVQLQQTLLHQYKKPVISFTMNIAGPMKYTPLISRGFHIGLERLECTLTAAQLPILEQVIQEEVTGCQGMFVVDGEASLLKTMCIQLEDQDPLGRLFDLDVLEQTGGLSREQMGFSPRPCLVCGQIGKGCASRRLHSVEELQQITEQILTQFFAHRDAQQIGNLAGKALMYEVCTTPKPGLVDRHNNGSHRDMDVFTFLDSTAALLPYFQQAVELGQQTAQLPPERTFQKLRPLGVAAEKAMFRSTGGINTHKGAVFTLGTVCAAVGRLWNPCGTLPSPASICSLCGAMSKQAMEAEFQHISHAPTTRGGQFYRDYGIKGIRGELAAGLPSVTQVALPVLEQELSCGRTIEESGAVALIHLMAAVQDTNLITRGGLEGQHWTAQQAQTILKEPLTMETIAALDQNMIARNLSPGGCADLLAVAYFLHLLSSLER